MRESLLRGWDEGPESRLAEMDSGRKNLRCVYCVRDVQHGPGSPRSRRRVAPVAALCRSPLTATAPPSTPTAPRTRPRPRVSSSHPTPRWREMEPPGSECCAVGGDGGCEAYTVIGWGGGLSHERSNFAEAETLGTVEGMSELDPATFYSGQEKRDRCNVWEAGALRAKILRCDPRTTQQRQDPGGFRRPRRR
jgi:hypothetical protein